MSLHRVCIICMQFIATRCLDFRPKSTGSNGNIYFRVFSIVGPLENTQISKF